MIGLALGAKLRAAGLVPRALAAWAGTDRLAALSSRLAAVPPAPGRAAEALELFVRGATLERTELPVDELIAAGLVEREAAGVRACVAVLPLGPSLLLCDREDEETDPWTVCWPDDSSHHLASAIPAGRRARWLDLACGSAFAALARPGLAARIECADLNPCAVDYARLGLALSGIEHVEVIEADVGAGGESAGLVTCNAPIPDALDPTLWHGTDGAFFARLFAAVPARLVPDPAGLAVIHCVLDAIPPDLPGERVIVQYTPPGSRAFAVLWWRPRAEARLVVAARELTVERPHVDAADRDDALAGAQSSRRGSES